MSSSALWLWCIYECFSFSNLISQPIMSYWGWTFWFLSLLKVMNMRNEKSSCSKRSALSLHWYVYMQTCTCYIEITKIPSNILCAETLSNFLCFKNLWFQLICTGLVHVNVNALNFIKTFCFIKIQDMCVLGLSIYKWKKWN